MSLFHFLFFEDSKPNCFSCFSPDIFQLSSHTGGLYFTCSNKSGSLFSVQWGPGLGIRLQVQPWQCWLRRESSPPWSCWLHPCRLRPVQSWLQVQPCGPPAVLAARDTAHSSLCRLSTRPSANFSEKRVHFSPFGPQPALVHGLLSSQLQEYLGFGIDCSKFYLLISKSYCWRCLY